MGIRSVPMAGKPGGMAQSLHLLLATVEDPEDPKAWSGTPFHMLRALQAHFARVTVLSTPKPQRGLLQAALRLLLGPQRYPLWMTRPALQNWAQRLQAAVAQHRPDAVLCISSQHLVHAPPMDLPVFMVSDAPWMAYKHAYQAYDALPLLASQYAQLEATAARRISGVIYPTPWACAEATARFGLAPEQVDCIALGANRLCADTDAQVQARIHSKIESPLGFLYVGKDWERKGGPLAVQTVRELNRLGCPCSLTIIGCTPEVAAPDAAHVRVLGFLSPDQAQHQKRLQTAFEQAHFFLVPSHAECFGLVFAEAQSYGLPCVALSSHGVPGVVDHGATGLLFAADTSAATIATQILALAQDRSAYQAMALAARAKFTRELNWEAFGQRMHQRITLACAANTTSAQP